ncbi:MAG: methionine--tRNA ligase [Candidatus Vogelbacteria bacterium RIFOXYD1_FULL_44_32]|uniref:Methionine--tRNA ligase n=1 Tax=Candidatus Vogelbacteria bacterium RIFOXYD1_FULL_44_32 TaxID=1802438 RepID=A0A1G2QFY5_9BACT|nr:MAG: methionine--tRNA ligase [Candidatus Vogelbacteria bacterium RIFOXYD1_FULL_44_32]
MFNLLAKKLLNIGKKRGGKKPFYITTTLPYVNAEPHIGFAMELVRADIIARYQKLIGRAVFFNTGTDEHGQKIYQKAVEAGLEPQAYVDSYATKFKALIPLLGISEDINFIRTTDRHHIEAAQEFWRRVDKAGFIYKKQYETKYCIGCELEKTDSELEDGRCPIHPNKAIELRAEENYFFQYSAFESRLQELYAKNPNLVVPDFRFNEIKNFVKSGLHDFSISRLKTKMPWGIAVPGDEEQVMYVWFDALVNYISAIGWPKDEAKFRQWGVESGGVVQYAGKDNLRPQAGMWQAMLLAVGLTPSQTIVIDGFINASDGQKMSKSIGNTISPHELVAGFGVEAVRYYMARHINDFEDFDFSLEKMTEAYNANLANGLGNLVSRVMKMASTHLAGPVSVSDQSIPADFKQAIANFELNKASNIIWAQIGELDKKIQTTEPFKLIKTEPIKAKAIITELVVGLYAVGQILEPIMPTTSATIKALVKANQMPTTPLFGRKD